MVIKTICYLQRYLEIRFCRETSRKANMFWAVRAYVKVLNFKRFKKYIKGKGKTHIDPAWDAQYDSSSPILSHPPSSEIKSSITRAP